MLHTGTHSLSVLLKFVFHKKNLEIAVNRKLNMQLLKEMYYKKAFTGSIARISLGDEGLDSKN